MKVKVQRTGKVFECEPGLAPGLGLVLQILQEAGIVVHVPETVPPRPLPKVEWTIGASRETGERHVDARCPACGEHLLYGKPTKKTEFRHCSGVERIPADVLKAFENGQPEDEPGDGFLESARKFLSQ